MVLRTNGLPNASPHWSPGNDWITWETQQGLLLVSPDGKREQLLTGESLIAHAWSKDGSAIFGLKYTDDQRLKLVSFNPRQIGHPGRELADLGPAIPVNNQVRGLTASADARTIATSVINRLNGDLYLLEGVHQSKPGPRWRELFRLP
jgi:hypothetical protein